MGHEADKTDKPFFTESGWTEKNNFVIEKTKNLEKLFKWLDSTDTLNCTNKPLSQYYNEYGLPSDELVNGKYISNNKTLYYRVEMFPPDDEDYANASEGEIVNWNKWFIDANGEKLVRLDTVLNFNYHDGNIHIINGKLEETNEYFYIDPDDNSYVLENSLIDSKDLDSYRGLLEILTDVKQAYETDTQEFRLAKFKQEFSKHLNLDYCLKLMK